MMENAAANDEARVEADRQMEQLQIREGGDDHEAQRDNEAAVHQMSNDEIIKAIREYLELDDGQMRLFWLDTALEYMQMDRVPKLIHQDVSGQCCWKLRHYLLIFAEPWLRAAAQRGSLEDDEGEGKDLLESFIHCSLTRRWFTAWVAAETGHKQLVLHLVKGQDPRGLELQEFGSSTSYSCWLYIIWRFLMGRDDSRHELESAGWKYVQRQPSFLRFAAAWGDVACIQSMLLNDVHFPKYSEGYNALHLASYFDHVDIVNLLLSHYGASHVNLVDRTSQRTPLHLASEQGCLASVKALIEHARDNNMQEWLVEAADVNGMTALHLASCRGHTQVVRQLLSQTTQPHFKSGKDLTREKIFLARSLRQWREDHELFSDTNWSDSWPDDGSATMWEQFNDCAELEACFNGIGATELINRLRSEIWSPGGFTALHFAVVYGKNIDTIRALLQHIEEQGEVVTLSKDDLGLTAADWAEVPGLEEVRRLFKDCTHVRANVRSGSATKALKWHYKQVEEAEQARKRLQWSLEMGEALLAKRWTEVWSLTNEGVKQEIKIDEPVWEHLEWAIQQTLAFEPTRQYRISLIERMVVELVKGKAFSNDSSTMQRCLMWAIELQSSTYLQDMAMVDLVEAIVRDRNCDLLSVARGCDYKKSPLERATDMGGSGLQLVAAMERRDDVQRRLYEDRQVYVDYANTILVGAVLIAALAYQGWVQQPQGYAAMPLKYCSATGMLIFAGCNSLGFFLSMGAVMAAAVAAMPLRSGQFVKFRAKSAKAGVLASLLLAASVVCEVIGFTMANNNIVSVDKAHHHMLFNIDSISTVLVLVLAAWFIVRLHNLQSFIYLIPFPQRLIYKPFYVYVYHPFSRRFDMSFFHRRIMPAFSSRFDRFNSLRFWVDDCLDRIDDRYDELQHQTSMRRSYSVNTAT